MPSGPEQAAAQGVINDLVQHEPDSHSFEPHVTLLHPISTSRPLDEITTTLREVVRGLPGGAKPLKLELKPADKGTFYFQSVLAPIQPSEQLLALRRGMEDVFPGPWKDKTYFPHLSLLYGDISPERRDELAQHVRDADKVPKTITFADIIVVDCTGTVRDWKTVGRVPIE